MNFCGFKRWSPTFNCTASWSVHEGIVLSSIITHLSQADGFVLLTGANDGFVKIWDIDSPSQVTSVPLSQNSLPEAEDDGYGARPTMRTLDHLHLITRHHDLCTIDLCLYSECQF
jgi:WD40 repeat protein